jgi:hypothetical protein
MKYDDFINEWKKARPKYKPFCYDGILLDNYWKKSSKIMFLLKETYNHFYTIRGHACGPEGTSKTFWRRMRMWTYIINEILKGNEPTFDETLAVKEEPNNSIAYVNLKKYAEKKEYNGMANSDDADIYNYVENDKVFLLKQIEYIQPKIILCCGTFKYCKTLFQRIDNIHGRLYKSNDIYIIDYFHLSHRGKYISDYKDLKSIAKYIK